MSLTINPDTGDYQVESTREYEIRMYNAVDGILKVATELHLTWDEFEEVLNRIKRCAYICVEPMTLGEESSKSQSSGS